MLSYPGICPSVCQPVWGYFSYYVYNTCVGIVLSITGKVSYSISFIYGMFIHFVIPKSIRNS